MGPGSLGSRGAEREGTWGGNRSGPPWREIRRAKMFSGSWFGNLRAMGASEPETEASVMVRILQRGRLKRADYVNFCKAIPAGFRECFPEPWRWLGERAGKPNQSRI